MQPDRSSLPRFSAAKSLVPGRRGVATAAALGLAILIPACFLGDTSGTPPGDTFYYPTSLVVSPGKATLYVTNSDFDLQYNGGTVVALDLAHLRENQILPLLAGIRAIGTGGKTVEDACKVLCPNAAPGELPAANCIGDGAPLNPDRSLNPGNCDAISLSILPTKGNDQAISSVTIGAFASGAVFVPRDGSTTDARLFIPVRGDPSITFIDVDNSGTFTTRFHCQGGSTGDPYRCGDDHRIGVDPFESSRGLLLPTEPLGIAASEDGKAIVVAHQTQKSVSLSINRWGDGSTAGTAPVKPTLEFILGGLPDGPTDVATVPVPRLFQDPSGAFNPAIDYQRGFLVTYRAAPVVDLLRAHVEENGSTPHPFLSRATETVITVNVDGKDSRGIAIDGDLRKACEDDCTATGAAAGCFLDCTKIPIDVFIANRTPPSLLVGRLVTTTIPEDSAAPIGGFDTLQITDSVALATGASRVAIGKVIGPDGNFARRVFATAFDSRLVFSYDPKLRQVDATFSTGRGPQSIAFDAGRDAAGKPSYALMYVGHFTDSYIGVVDLDMRPPARTFGTMFASLGKPKLPKESR